MSELPAHFELVEGLLGSTSSVCRMLGIKILKSHNNLVSKKLSPAKVSSHLNHLCDHGRVRALNTDLRDRLAGIGILESLIEADDQHSVERRIGILNFLRNCLDNDLSSHSQTFYIQVVASVLGRLSRVVMLKPEFQLLEEHYLTKSLDWLRDVRYEVRRYAAAVLLSELIANLPALMLDARDSFHARLMDALPDPSLQVREVVACAIGSFMHLLYSRTDALDASSYFGLAANIISEGLLRTSASRKQNHGAMLLLAAILRQDPCTSSTFVFKHSSSKFLPGKYWQPPSLPNETLNLWLNALLGSKGLHAEDVEMRLVSVALLPPLIRFVSPPLALLEDTTRSVLSILDLGHVSFAAICRSGSVIARLLDGSLGGSLFEQMTEVVSSTIISSICNFNNDLPVMKCLAVFIQCIGENILRSQCRSVCSCDTSNFHRKIRSKIQELLPCILRCSLSRTIFALIHVLNEYFPSFRLSIQNYVYTEVVRSLKKYKLEQCLNLGREVTFRTGFGEIWLSIFDGTQSLSRSLPNLVEQHGASVKSTLYFLSNPVDPDPVAISNMELVFGMLSKLNFFEKQQTHCSSKFLVEMVSVVIDLVANSEPAIQLESSIICWKCLKRLTYLNQSSTVDRHRNVPLAFMQFVIERVFSAAITGHGHLCHVIIYLFPVSCDSLIVMAPKLLRMISFLSFQKPSSAQRVAWQCLSRFIDQLPMICMPRISACLGCVVPELTPPEILLAKYPCCSGMRMNLMAPRIPNRLSSALRWLECKRWESAHLLRSDRIFYRRSPDRGLLEALTLLVTVIRRGSCSLVLWVPTCLPAVARILAKTEVRDSVAPIAACLLGQLAMLCTKSVAPMTSKIIPKVVDVLCEQPVDEPQIRCLAASALEQLVSASGDVVTSYGFDTQRLIDALLHMLKSRWANQDIQALRTLGALGALDPSFIAIFQGPENHLLQTKGETALHMDLRAIDLPKTPVYFRKRLNQMVNFNLQIHHVQIKGVSILDPLLDHNCWTLPPQDVFSTVSLEALLDTVANLPQFRREALRAVGQICCWLAPDACPLHKTLDQLLRTLISPNFKKCRLTKPSYSAFLPAARQRHAQIQPVANDIIEGQENGIDDHLAQMIINNVVFILKFITPAAIVLECSSGQLPVALTYLWSHVISDDDEMSLIRGEGLLQMVRCLHLRLPQHCFVFHLRWILPPILHCVVHCAIYPALHAIDLIAISLVASRDVTGVIGTILNQLTTTLSCPGDSRSSSFHVNSRAPLLLVSAIRLVNCVNCKGVINEVASSFMKSMTMCLSKSFLPSTSDLGPQPFNKDLSRTVSYQCGSLIPELAICGLTIMARQLHVCVIPYLHHVQAALSKWFTAVQKCLETSNQICVENFWNSDSCCYGSLSAHVAMHALTEYHNVEVAITRGRPLPLHEHTPVSTHIISGDYASLFDTLMSSQPYRLWQFVDWCESMPRGPRGLFHSIAPSGPVHRHTISFSFDPALVKSDFITDLATLQRVWENDGLVTNDEWTEWIHRVSVESLRQSPSPYLRPCASIAEVHQPVARLLVKPVFFSLWVGFGLTAAHCLGGPNRLGSRLTRSLSLAICSRSLPYRFLTMLLEVTEYMRMYCAPIPTDIALLAREAFRGHLFEKALTMHETLKCSQFHRNQFTDREIEAFVTTNNHLGLSEAATGVLAAHGLAWPKPRLYEELKQWDAALAIYEADEAQARSHGLETLLAASGASENLNYVRPINFSNAIASFAAWLDAEVGRLRCNSALYDHKTVSDTAHYLWDLITSCLNTLPDCISKQSSRNRDVLGCYVDSGRTAACVVVRQYHNWLINVAILGAHSSWVMQTWDNMDMYITFWDTYKARELRQISEHKLDNKSEFPRILCLSCRSHELLLYQAVLVLRPLNLAQSYQKVMSIKSVLCQANSLVQAARVQLLLDAKLHLNAGYSHTYYYVMSAQQLAELEEILWLENRTYRPHSVTKHHVHNTGLLLHVLSKWKRRMRWWGGVDSGMWQDVLLVRKLILCPRENVEVYLRLADLCQNSGQFSRCGNILAFLDSPLPRTSFSQVPNVSISVRICRLLWISGSRRRAFELISRLTDHVASQFCIDQHRRAEALRKETLVSCILLQSEWCGTLSRDKACYPDMKDIIPLLRQVVDIVPLQPRVWHSWALANYELCDQIERRQLGSLRMSETSKFPQMSLLTRSNVKYAAQALNCFFKSFGLFGASCSKAKNVVILQDTLRLLTMWFRHGTHPQVNREMRKGIIITRIDVWLGVLPQLIARVNHPVMQVRYLVANILVQVGRTYPQALVYPITVSATAVAMSRRTASVCILNSLQQSKYCRLQENLNVHNINQETEALVAEANLVSRELHHLAITWHEAWYEGIENAANLFFGDLNTKTTLASLSELHTRWRTDTRALVGTLPQPDASGNVRSELATIRLAAFMHVHGPNLKAAESYLYRFSRRGIPADIHQAWNMYSLIHRHVRCSLFKKEFLHLDLGQVSPSLLSARNMRLSVPGADSFAHKHPSNSPVVQIMSFCRHVKILDSKQRPRWSKMFGSDGREYEFLLKGHEDLRQDERVMQLFGLINALLNATTCINGNTTEPLHVQQFVIMPLSSNSGLIGWVHDCSTIYQWIIEHRAHFSIPYDVESLFATSIASEYNKLVLLQKIDGFNYILSRTNTNDLSKMLCITSRDVAAWLKRRTRFTCSLAVTSVVGYILGLGDRHVSNIMISNKSGEIIHIDFGDCFEVAMNREKFPEKVPFRLTKLLVNAMEVSGVEGSYRLACNCVMKVLRSNYHSLMAMLEAFVHDPLVCWKVDVEYTLGCHMLKQALRISDCVQKKLTGCLLNGPCMSPIQQVDILICQARSAENLCQMFGGWCPFW